MANLHACLSCGNSADDGRPALQCDVCNKWAHIDCVGVSKQAYKLGGKLEGFQWFCPKCLVDWGSMKPTVLDLENELKVLQAEASKVPLLEQALNEIQATVKELASTIDFLTSDHTSTTPAPPKSILPHIPESPNRFAVLQTLEDGSKQHNLQPLSQPTQSATTYSDLQQAIPLTTPTAPNPQCPTTPHDKPGILPESVPIPPTCPEDSHTYSPCKCQESPLPQPDLQSASCQTERALPNRSQTLDNSLVTLYLRNVPTSLSIQTIKDTMAKEGISVAGLSIEPVLSDSSFTGARKFVKISFDSLASCNSLDQTLKNKPHLPWFLSLYPPQNRIPLPTQNQSFLEYRQQSNHPPVQQCQIPPLMSLKLPPLPTQVARYTRNSMQSLDLPPQKKHQIPALMGLQLPPLPIHVAQIISPHA